MSLAALAVMLLPARPASAQTALRHPLGNFSINQYLGLRLYPDRVEARAVIDVAEIPTLQDRSTVDSSGDGAISAAERAAHATVSCNAVASAIDARVNHDRLAWTTSRSEFIYAAGSGGLDVSRLGCTINAAARLDEPTRISIINGYLADRVGWREMTATGHGVRLLDSPLPTGSVTNELRDYPKDLLSSALDVRTATLRVEPGEGGEGTAAMVRPSGDPVSRWMAVVERRFQRLAGGPKLTPPVGLLAVLLAVLLGAGHAALPGHGKTVLAAYLAGQRGRPRDALAIAGTVTLTHSGGVLVLGMILTAGTAVAGEEILSWLGLVSGALVLLVGVGMFAGILRRRRHSDADRRRRSHDHHHAHQDHAHHDHAHHDHAHNGHTHRGDSVPGAALHSHTHAGADHRSRHGRDEHHEHHEHGRPGRLGIASIGLAGGLVPSPSALIVLLAAIALGRTGFGVLLVVAYGVGMAATLTGAGLLLLAVQRRVARSTAGRLSAGLTRLMARVQAATPAATAALVVLVGLGLAARAAAGVV